MDRKQILVVSALILAISIGGSILAVASLPAAQGTQTVSTDVEVLNVARPAGVFLSLNPANFTAAFSFSPGKQFVQTSTVLLTLIWDQFSKGHVGDQLVGRLNAQSSSVFSMNVQTTKVVALNAGDLRVGANVLDIGLIPVSPFATTDNTSYLLFEARLTIEYTIIA